jgi:acetyltransferase-like isoleucine patch superfamily enzyme
MPSTGVDRMPSFLRWLFPKQGGHRGFRRNLRLALRGVPAHVLAHAGRDFLCGRGAFFRPGESVEIGDHVFMGRSVHVASPLTIGNDVMIASYVAFIGGDHRFDDVGVVMRDSGRGNARRIVIEDDVWIGHGAILLHGVRVGRGSVVGAGSVVTKSVPPCTIVAGNPARKIRDRFSTPADAERHLAFLTNRYNT